MEANAKKHRKQVRELKAELAAINKDSHTARAAELEINRLYHKRFGISPVVTIDAYVESGMAAHDAADYLSEIKFKLRESTHSMTGLLNRMGEHVADMQKLGKV